MVASTTRETATDSTAPHQKQPYVKREVQNILDWPTDTVSIDYYGSPQGSETSKQHYPHTLLLFVPGNPGLVHWYVDLLKDLVADLGVGFAARGLSYAGHGLTPEIVNVEQWSQASNTKSTDIRKATRTGPPRDTSIPWTLEGQIQHKLAWVEQIRLEMNNLANEWASDKEFTPIPRFIFVSHSIGAYMVQRMCSLRQNEILRNTQLLIHLMPFIRMDAPQPRQAVLTTIAQSQEMAIAATKALSYVASWIPEAWLDASLRDSVQCDRGRKVATTLIRQPTFARNYLELGCQELRQVPRQPEHDVWRLLGKHCDAALLYAGGPDTWGPYHHVEDLLELQRGQVIPNNVQVTYKEELRHDFIVQPSMVPIVREFCLDAIRTVMKRETGTISSRL